MSATTRAVAASMMLLAVRRPVRAPATSADSVSMAPITDPPSPIVTFLAVMSPFTLPETCNSPDVTMSPVTCRSRLRIEGAAALLEGTESGLDFVVNILANPHETSQPADDQESGEPKLRSRSLPAPTPDHCASLLADW